jgi:hypothetical protein
MMLIIEVLTVGAFFGLGISRCWPRARSAVQHGTNFIANGTTDGSAERIAGPAALHKLPNFINQLRSLFAVWSFWSDVLVYNEVANFGRADMTKWNLVGINLVKSFSHSKYSLPRFKITSYDVIPNA